MRVIAIAGAKGGTGKTTTAVNLAAALAERGERVALQDLDPQASATLALGIDATPDPWTAAPRSLELDGLPEPLTLRPGGRLLMLAGERDAGALLDNSGESWDALVYDCPPGLDRLALAAIEAADLVLVPLEATPLALASLSDVAALLPGSRRTRLRAVLVRSNPRRILTADVRERVERTYRGALYGTQIPEDVRAAEAPGHGLPVTVYAPSSRAAAAYRELAREVLADLTKPYTRRRA